METINIGEKRKWINNDEEFTVIGYEGIHHGNHWFVIEYETDNRKQTIQESVLISKTVAIRK